MSVVARTNKQGTFWYTVPKSFRRQTWTKEGVITDTIYETRTETVHGCRKTGSKGQIVFLSPGSRTPFRMPTTFSRTVIEYSASKEVWRWSNPDGSGGWEETGYWNDTFEAYHTPGSMIVANVPRQDDPTGLGNEAIAKALAKIRDQKANIGENLATLRQTTNMFAENAYKLGLACLAFKRGQWNAVRSILQNRKSVIRLGADHYLQYKYGWKPLMNDIYKSLEESKNLAKDPLLLYGAGKSQVLAPYGYSSIFFPSTRSIEGSGSQMARCVLWGKLNGEILRALDSLGLANPLRLAWDLVPLSFVTDWFLPIGPCLDSLVPPKGIDFVAGYRQLKTEIHMRQVRKPTGIKTGDPCINTCKFFAFDRVALPTWPRAGLYNVKDPLKLSNIASAVALTAQQLFK